MGEIPTCSCRAQGSKRGLNPRENWGSPLPLLSGPPNSCFRVRRCHCPTQGTAMLLLVCRVWWAGENLPETLHKRSIFNIKLILGGFSQQLLGVLSYFSSPGLLQQQHCPGSAELFPP